MRNTKSRGKQRTKKQKKEPRSLGKFTSAYSDFLRAPQQEEKKENWYIKYCRRAGKTIKAKNEFKNVKYKAALDFLGWDLKPKEINAAPIFTMIIGFGIAIPILAYLLFSMFFLGMSFFGMSPYLVLMYMAIPLIFLPMLLGFYMQTYVIKAAESQKMQSITYISEIVSYMVMSMKLTPNLERAVEFAAQHGRGKIAEDLKRVLWDVKIGTKRSMEEGLDEIAYKWGAFSDEFKHALILIRASVIEIDEAKQHVILDKAVTDTLQGMKEDMDKYATKMRQPSIYLYYVGVLLPLMLIIMLPIGAMMAKLPLAESWILILLYNVAIPVGAVFFASTILAKRPPVYTPPHIPDDHPGLPKKNHIKIGKSSFPAIILAIVALIAIYFSFTYVLDPVINPLPPIYDLEAIAAHYPFFQIAGVVIGISFAASIYLYGSSIAKRKVQKQIMEMEEEFQDSVYILASRLGENRPMEEALDYSADFLKGTKIAGLFRKTTDNIRNLGMTVDTAFFDPSYGSLRDIPSDTIKGSVRIVVDSLKLGVQQAARALISLSLQLRDSQKVKERIKVMLEEITAMMKSIAFLIAPLVLGITTALQKIIISALQSLSGTEAAGAAGSFGSVNVPNMPMVGIGDPGMLQNIPSPTVFLLIIAAYVIEITLILIYFTSKIEEGDNALALKINIARSLPIATILFFFAAWFAAQMTAVI